MTRLGFDPARDDDRLPVASKPGAPAAPLVLWRVPDTSGTGGATQFVDLQRDATVADIARAVGAGLRSVEHVKRYTTIGTAHDQGKTSGVIASGIVAELLGIPVQQTGTTTFRPPYTPVAFAASWARTTPARLFRSVIASASTPPPAASANNSSQEEAPRRNEKWLAQPSSA